MTDDDLARLYRGRTADQRAALHRQADRLKGPSRRDDVIDWLMTGIAAVLFAAAVYGLYYAGWL